MGDLYKALTDSMIPSELQSTQLDQLTAYEEHYMKLLKNYKSEIAGIESMMHNLRKERETFYSSTLPEIERKIREDEVLSEDSIETWILELRSNIERSFQISEELISHYVTSNLNEFKEKMQESLDRI